MAPTTRWQGMTMVAVGGADVAGGAGFADLLRQFGVGGRLAVGNFWQALPDLELEGGALRSEREVESAQLTGKVGGELADGFSKKVAVLLPVGGRRLFCFFVGKGELAQPGFVGGQQQGADGAVEAREIHDVLPLSIILIQLTAALKAVEVHTVGQRAVGKTTALMRADQWNARRLGGGHGDAAQVFGFQAVDVGLAHGARHHRGFARAGGEEVERCLGVFVQ